MSQIPRAVDVIGDPIPDDAMFNFGIVSLRIYEDGCVTFRFGCVKNRRFVCWMVHRPGQRPLLTWCLKHYTRERAATAVHNWSALVSC